MVIVRKPMILLVDVIGAVAVAALLGVGVRYVVMPGWEARSSLPELREGVNLAHKELTALQLRNTTMNDAVTRAQAALDSGSARALADGGKLLEMMSAECARHDVELLRIEPLPADQAGAVRTWRATVTARGGFPNVYEVLRTIENWSRYIRIEEIDIHAPPVGADGECEVRWNVAISYLAEALPSGGASP